MPRLYPIATGVKAATRPPQRDYLALFARSLTKHDDQRALMRAAVVLSTDSENDSREIDWRDVAKRSPLISTYGSSASGAVAPRATTAGMRDYMSVDAITAICIGLQSWIDTARALMDPSKHSMPSSAASHGYDFGRDAECTDFRIENALNRRDAKLTKLIEEGKTDLDEVAAYLTDKLSSSTRAILHDAITRYAHDKGLPFSGASAKTGASAPSSTGATASTLADKELVLTSTPRSIKKDMTAMTKNTKTELAAIDTSITNVADAVRYLTCADRAFASLDIPSRVNDMADFLKSLDAASDKLAPVLTAMLNGMELGYGDTYTGGSNGAKIANLYLEYCAALAEAGTADTTAKPAEETTALSVKLPKVMELPDDAAVLKMVNAVLSSVSLPTIEEIHKHELEMHTAAETAVRQADTLRDAVKKAKSSAMFSAKVEGATDEPKDADGKPIPSGAKPEGKVVMQNAADLFGVTGKARNAFNFNVPTFDWAFTHPDVPDYDENYLFRPDNLITILIALVKNQQPWLHGHTGTGKSTMIEQVAARLSWPVIRVNFDSEITRMDLVGKDTLITDPKTGQTITEWVDGILPQALRGPYILMLDELDFVRPDVAYVMQRIGEGKGLMLNENGGEWVKPHPMFRLFATANTVGQGDEHGMYQGARPQSLAFLDRFYPFVEVPYLTEKQETNLIKSRFPDVDTDTAALIGKYVTEHRQAFTSAQIMQPLSPRGVGAVADNYTMLVDLYDGDKKAALRKSLKDMVFAKASGQDAAVLKGIIDKVVA